VGGCTADKENEMIKIGLFRVICTAPEWITDNKQRDILVGSVGKNLIALRLYHLAISQYDGFLVENFLFVERSFWMSFTAVV